VPEDERSSETCLHCKINEVVQEHIEGDDPVNLPDLVEFIFTRRLEKRFGEQS
jgi:hypothetical protein